MAESEPNVMKFVQALKDTGFNSLDEVLDISTGTLINHFYGLVEQKCSTDEELKEVLQRMDEAHYKVMEALQDLTTPAEAYLTLLIVQRNILDAVVDQHKENDDDESSFLADEVVDD